MNQTHNFNLSFMLTFPTLFFCVDIEYANLSDFNKY